MLNDAHACQAATRCGCNAFQEVEDFLGCGLDPLLDRANTYPFHPSARTPRPSLGPTLVLAATDGNKSARGATHASVGHASFLEIASFGG